VPSDVLHIVRHTINTLAREIPVDLKVELQLHQADTLMNFSDASTKSFVASHLFHLLKTCILRAVSLPEGVRTRGLQMCLYGLWHWGKALHQYSLPFPSDFFDLAGLEITRHILTERDQTSRVMGRCVEALVINIVARTSDSTGQNNEKTLGLLSAFLGLGNRDVTLWLSRPSAIELMNIVSLAFGDIGSLTAVTVPSYVRGVVLQTFGMLSRALPAEINSVTMQDQIPDSPADIPNHDGQCELILRSTV
jgi:hypothetical protein